MEPFNCQTAIKSLHADQSVKVVSCKLITSYNFRPYSVEFSFSDRGNEVSSEQVQTESSSNTIEFRYTALDSLERVIGEIDLRLDRPASTVSNQFNYPIVQLKCDYLGAKFGNNLSFLTNLESLNYAAFFKALELSDLVIVKSRKNDLYFFYREHTDIDQLLAETETSLYKNATTTLRSIVDFYFNHQAKEKAYDNRQMVPDRLLHNELLALREKLNNVLFTFGERDISTLCDICMACKKSDYFKNYLPHDTFCQMINGDRSIL